MTHQPRFFTRELATDETPQNTETAAARAAKLDLLLPIAAISDIAEDLLAKHPHKLTREEINLALHSIKLAARAATRDALKSLKQ